MFFLQNIETKMVRAALVAGLGLLAVLMCAARAEASCGDYLIRLDSPGVSPAHPDQGHDWDGARKWHVEEEQPSDKRPCDGPHCGQLPPWDNFAGESLHLPLRSGTGHSASLASLAWFPDTPGILWFNLADDTCNDDVQESMLRPPQAMLNR